jgi:hypothetical protein
MKWMVKLYPAAWRERYGEEFATVLEKQPTSLGLLMDVLGGAVDARLHPQPAMAQTSKTNGDEMTSAMFQRCMVGGPKLSTREQKAASMAMIASALVMAVLYIVLRKIYHAAPAVEAVGYASFPAMSLIYAQAAYLRKRPWFTQVLIVFAGCAGMYAFMFGACLIAAKL